MKVNKEFKILLYDWKNGKCKPREIVLKSVDIDMVGNHRVRLSGNNVSEEEMEKAIGFVTSKGKPYKKTKGKGTYALVIFPANLGHIILYELQRETTNQLDMKEWKSFTDER